MNNLPPIREDVTRGWTPSWSNWFQQVFECLRWNRSFNSSATLDFASIPSTGQSTLTLNVPGVRVGDAVMLTAAADVSGVIFTGTISAPGVISVTAKNITAAPVNPAPQSFRFLVFQN